MKITKEIIEEMKEIRKGGAKILEIAAKFKISDSTVRYHINEDYKEKTIIRAKKYWKNLPDEKKKRIYKSRRKYLRKYYLNRYWKDREYRKKRIEYSRSHHKKMEDLK